MLDPPLASLDPPRGRVMINAWQHSTSKLHDLNAVEKGRDSSVQREFGEGSARRFPCLALTLAYA